MMFKINEGADVEPLPDFVSWLQRSARLHVPPWELFEPDQTQPPKWWWIQASDVYYAAYADAEAKVRERHEKKHL